MSRNREKSIYEHIFSKLHLQEHPAGNIMYYGLDGMLSLQEQRRMSPRSVLFKDKPKILVIVKKCIEIGKKNNKTVLIHRQQCYEHKNSKDSTKASFMN